MNVMRILLSLSVWWRPCLSLANEPPAVFWERNLDCPQVTARKRHRIFSGSSADYNPVHSESGVCGSRVTA